MDSGSATLVSLILAVYGAVIATLVAIWNVYQQVVAYRDELAVQVVRAEMVQGGAVIATDKLWFKVTNVGRQPVWLNSIGGRNQRGSERSHFLVATPQLLPVKLEPGEAFNDASIDLKKTDLARVKYFAAWDSKGKVHKAPKRQLQDVIKGGKKPAVT